MAQEEKCQLPHCVGEQLQQHQHGERDRDDVE